MRSYLLALGFGSRALKGLTERKVSGRSVCVCVWVGGWGGIGALFPHKDQVYEIQRSVTIQDFQFERDGIEVLRVGMSGTPIPCNIL